MAAHADPVFAQPGDPPLAASIVKLGPQSPASATHLRLFSSVATLKSSVKAFVYCSATGPVSSGGETAVPKPNACPIWWTRTSAPTIFRPVTSVTTTVRSPLRMFSIRSAAFLRHLASGSMPR